MEPNCGLRRPKAIQKNITTPMIFCYSMLVSNKFSDWIVKNWKIWLQTSNTKWLVIKIKQLIWKNILIFFKKFQKFQKKNFFFQIFKKKISNYFLHIIMDAGFLPRFAKVRPSFQKKLSWKPSFDMYLKWLLGADQKNLFTFSNPTLKSAV